MKLKEGKTYPFSITGLVTLPDKVDYFVLTDPNNVKHLLAIIFYLHYNFKFGQQINCRIDKINCSGKIFIEPEHPHYKLNQSYFFPYLRTEEYKDGQCKPERYAFFSDAFGNEIKMPVDDLPGDYEAKQKINFLITRIKKGKVYISRKIVKEIYNEFNEGKEYPFIISQFKKHPGKRSYYVIKSQSGLTFKLRRKYYKKYNFELGQTIYCRLVSEGEDRYLEPRHPFYKIGKEYKFMIKNIEYIDEYPDIKKQAFILKNKYGKDSIVLIENVNKEKIQDGKLQCRVEDIRKSRLYLKPIYN